VESWPTAAQSRGSAAARPGPVPQGVPGGTSGSRGIVLLILAAIAVWLASGFYRVQPDEQGVVLRFGKWLPERTTLPGFHTSAVSDRDRADAKVTTVNRSTSASAGSSHRITSRRG